jgi:serine/threonine protein kinase
MAQSLPVNPKVIGRYTILRELRRDRHSVSYAAVDPILNRELIVKAVQIVPPGPPIRADARKHIEQAFRRQAAAAGRLHHSNILTVFDAWHGHDFGYLVIERVVGRSLQDLLASGVKFTDLQCAGIGARVADAIEYAHGQGVSHGQLGPAHVYIQADGSPKVSGFGGWIDAGDEGDDALTRTEQFLPYFQSEITAETRQRDLRSVASLLCTMIQARPHAVTVSSQPPTTTGGRSQRPATIPAFSALLSDSLNPKSPTAPKTAGELRDALISFVLMERGDRPTTSALGVSLSASLPAAGPSSASAAEATPSTVTRERPDLVALALERLGESLRAARSRLGKLKPWARQHRLALALAPALLLISLALGNLLVQLHPAKVTAPVVAERAPSDPGPDPTVASTAAPASTGEAGSGTVVFRIEPWGEILIDNKPTGVSPPLLQIPLAAGKHVIEVRHGNDAPWTENITVEAALPVKVEHRFE